MSKDKKFVDREPMPITVGFRKCIRTDGALEVVQIRQESDELRLTPKQAQSLGRELSLRFPEDEELKVKPLPKTGHPSRFFQDAKKV